MSVSVFLYDNIHVMHNFLAWFSSNVLLLPNSNFRAPFPPSHLFPLFPLIF